MLANGFELRQAQRTFKQSVSADANADVKADVKADANAGNQARQRLFPVKKSKANDLFA